MVLKNLAAWRRKVLSVCFLLLLISSQRNNVTPVSRSCRRLTRNIGWWENTWKNYLEARFKKTFRVSRSTFSYILNRIGPFLARETDRGSNFPRTEASALFISIRPQRLFLYHCRDGRSWSIYCLLYRKWSLPSPCWPSVEWVRVQSYAQDSGWFQEKNVRYGWVLAIPLLLGSNRRLSYSH